MDVSTQCIEDVKMALKMPSFQTGFNFDLVLGDVDSP